MKHRIRCGKGTWVVLGRGFHCRNKTIKGVRVLVHKSHIGSGIVSGDEWVVTERSTGTGISRDESRDNAIRLATRRIASIGGTAGMRKVVKSFNRRTSIKDAARTIVSLAKKLAAATPAEGGGK